MSCVCSYGYEEGDEACEVWREGRVQSTRKEHKCCECEEAIPIGSRCCSAFSVSSEGPQTFYRCLSCAALAELVAEINQACPLWGGLQYSLDGTDIDWHEWREKAKAIA